MVKKTVDITSKQKEWIEKQPINFSKYVRNKINKDMEAENE